MGVAIQLHIMVAPWHLKQNIRTNGGKNMEYFDENVIYDKMETKTGSWAEKMGGHWLGPV